MKNFTELMKSIMKFAPYRGSKFCKLLGHRFQIKTANLAKNLPFVFRALRVLLSASHERFELWKEMEESHMGYCNVAACNERRIDEG